MRGQPRCKRLAQLTGVRWRRPSGTQCRTQLCGTFGGTARLSGRSRGRRRQWYRCQHWRWRHRRCFWNSDQHDKGQCVRARASKGRASSRLFIIIIITVWCASKLFPHLTRAPACPPPPQSDILTASLQAQQAALHSGSLAAAEAMRVADEAAAAVEAVALGGADGGTLAASAGGSGDAHDGGSVTVSTLRHALRARAGESATLRQRTQQLEQANSRC